MARIRWRRNKHTQWNGPTLFDLWDGRTVYAHVQSMQGGWFWYADGANTCNEPVSTEKEAKAAAMAHVRAALKEDRT